MPVSAARPVVERIAVVLFGRLQLLAAGFAPSTYVPEVVRPTRMGGFTPQHMQVVMTQDDPEEVPELMIPGNPPAIAFRQVFNIRCHVMPSEKDPTPLDEYINTVSSDVVLAVTSTGAQWHTMGGLAIDSQWLTRERVEHDGSFAGINVPIAVTYRTSERNPYQHRG